MTDSASPESHHLDRPPGRYCAWHSTEIAANTEEIWQTLEKFEEWERWNPLYVESKGVLSEGDTIQFTVALSGMKPQRGKARVAKVRRPEFIQYEIRGLGGLVGGIRFIEIQQIAPGLCKVTNGEIMTGLFAPLLFRAMGERIRQGLEGMNMALKGLLEGSADNARRD